MKNILKEDGSIDFDLFDRLTEEEQGSIMEGWSPEQRMAYFMQNTISEEECFGPVLKLIDEIEQGLFDEDSTRTPTEIDERADTMTWIDVEALLKQGYVEAHAFHSWLENSGVSQSSKAESSD